MTPSQLPQKLWRPLAEVKNFLEKMPDGAKLSDVSRKVKAFSELSLKERNNLVSFLNERESILVIKAVPEGGKNNTIFLRHKKYGFPSKIDGFTITSKSVRPDAIKKRCSKCFEVKEAAEFYSNKTTSDGLQSYCISCVKHSTKERSWEKGDNYARRIKNDDKEPPMTETKQDSPEELRRKAEELIKAAEEAEKKRFDSDFLNKKLSPVRLEIAQASGMMRRKLDDLIDSIDTLNKAVQKLKDLTA